MPFQSKINQAAQTKLCTICGPKYGPLSLDNFFSFIDRRNGKKRYQSMCKNCKREYNRETMVYYRRNHSDKVAKEGRHLNQVRKMRTTISQRERTKLTKETIVKLQTDYQMTIQSIADEARISQSLLYAWLSNRHQPTATLYRRLFSLYASKLSYQDRIEAPNGD